MYVVNYFVSEIEIEMFQEQKHLSKNRHKGNTIF